MTSLLPVGVALTSVSLTYVLCLRPMRRGRCVLTSSTTTSGTDQLIELGELQREVAALRDAQAASTTPPAHPMTGTGQ